MGEHYLYLLCALVFTTTGQLLYRHYHNTKKHLFLLLTLISFILVPFFSYKSLIGLSIDVVYMATSITIVFVLLGGRVLLKEELSKHQILGSILIILGIVIYNV
ncbi:MAG: EamA family transporter [Flavobacteriales bacterium]|nr:EamA family transporter [Flavobacteriales bacterium]